MTLRTLIIKIKQEITFTSPNISDIENPSIIRSESLRIKHHYSNKNTQNLSILVRYANFCVKKLCKNNAKIARFHWTRQSRDSCPTSVAPYWIFSCAHAHN